MNVEERIFQRIDKFEERLDDTCNRIEKIDSYITLERENSEEDLIDQYQYWVQS